MSDNPKPLTGAEIAELEATTAWKDQDNPIPALVRTIDRLVEVVRWYEDKAHHKEKHVYHGRTIVASLTSEIEQDQGQRARGILKEMGLL